MFFKLSQFVSVSVCSSKTIFLLAALSRLSPSQAYLDLPLHDGEVLDLWQLLLILLGLYEFKVKILREVGDHCSHVGVSQGFAKANPLTTKEGSPTEGVPLFAA